MKLLITPAEVSALCFGGDQNMTADFIKDSSILTAQRKFIFPVTGQSLWAELERNRYPSLVNGYIKSALALYVKYLILPAIYSQAGMLGVVQYAGQGFGSAGKDEFLKMRGVVKREADSLVRILSEHLESSSGSYPEYDASENILNSFNIGGGVVV